MAEHLESYLEKAGESLQGAESEYASERYNNAVNRSYYACFQSAIAALQRAGIMDRNGYWAHDFVVAQFDGQLIYRRKLYPAELRGMLSRNYLLRETADYNEVSVSRVEAGRALARARSFVSAIQAGEER